MDADSLSKEQEQAVGAWAVAGTAGVVVLFFGIISIGRDWPDTGYGPGDVIMEAVMVFLVAMVVVIVTMAVTTFARVNALLVADWWMTASWLARLVCISLWVAVIAGVAALA